MEYVYESRNYSNAHITICVGFVFVSKNARKTRENVIPTSWYKKRKEKREEELLKRGFSLKCFKTKSFYLQAAI